MKIFFYDIIPIEERYKEWEDLMFPGHLLYGVTHLKKYGIETFYKQIPFNPYKNRIRLMYYNLKYILSHRKKFDLLYGVTHRGLEIIIFLRALGLFRKPIVLWHHSAVVVPKNIFWRPISKLFYKGIDHLFFFSESLKESSLKTGKVREQNVSVIHWGADLKFYDNIEAIKKNSKFISTGRENRDFVTLIKAFNRTSYTCDILTGLQVGNKNYKDIIVTELQEPIKENISLSFTNKTPYEIAEKVKAAHAVVICCMDYPYTVGLTTLVEALALGKPIISTDNPTFPFDIEKENIGIKVPYGDVEGWIKALDFFSTHPEKIKEWGENGRLLAQNTFNLDILSKEVAELLITYKTR